MIAKIVTTERLMSDAVRLGAVARRVMHLLHLGSAWNQVAMWIDRRRPPLQIADWSEPLLTRLVMVHSTNPLTPAADGPMGAPAADSTRQLPAALGTNSDPILRCLLVTPRLDAGGMEEVIAFLARWLPSRGWRTAVLCTNPDAIVDGKLSGRTAQLLQSKGVEVFGAEPRRAFEFARHWRPDVISAHGAPDWVFTLGSRLGTPYVDNLHSLNGLIGRDWRWHSEAVRSGYLAGVVAVSDVLRRQQLAVNPSFPAEQIVTIPNGVDGERFKSVDRADSRNSLGISDEYVFVSLGRYCMQKNSYGLITAFGDVARHRPEAHLVIAGKISEPRYYRRVLQLRDKMPCRERIHLRNHTSAPGQLLAAADGFVLNSFFEGWPLASMEALVAGVPVIMADVSGAREQIAAQPARGYVVANPLEEPLRADWASSAAAQYRPHANREELATAMELLVANRQKYLRDRSRLADESAARFSSSLWLERHAVVLRAAATGAALPDPSQISPPAQDSHAL